MVLAKCWWMWAWGPAWALPSWVRGPRSPRPAWSRSSGALGCGLGVQPASPTIHVPEPASPFLLQVCTARHCLLRTAAGKQTSALHPAPGWGGGAARPPSRLAPPPHVHRREWPENASPVCPDRMLPALGTSMAPAWCFQAIDAGAGPGRAAGGRAVGAACGRWQSDGRDGRDEGPGVGPRRAPPRGVGEPPGRGLTGQARRLCKRYWPSRPTVPGQHSGHSVDEKTKSRMGLAPRCPARNSTQRLVPDAQDPTYPVGPGSWHWLWGGWPRGAERDWRRGMLHSSSVSATAAWPRRRHARWTGRQRGAALPGSYGPTLQVASVDLLADWGGEVARTCSSLCEDRIQGPAGPVCCPRDTASQRQSLASART